MSAETACVVIPTYNRHEGLRRCLASLMRGERRPEQIVVCDQSRDDATRRVVEEHPAEGVEIVYLHLDEAGASGARNAGIEAAGTELVAFIDDDCKAGPAWLAALVGAYAAASEDEAVSGVTGRVLPAPSRRPGVPISSRTSTERRRYRAHEGGMERGEWAPWDTGTGASLLAPRATLESIGGFDRSLGPGTPSGGGEDIDILYRLARVGTIVYEPEAVIYHPTGTRRKRLSSRYTYGRGMGSMFAKHLAGGDPAARQLLRLYVRHQGMQSLRRGAWGPVEAVLGLAGVSAPVARHGFDRLRRRYRV